jgi:hypothetical protein
LFENSRKYLQLKVHHLGKFTAGVVDTGGNLSPVILTPVANLQRWLRNFFSKFPNSWAQSAIANPQISEICESAN